MRGRCVGCESRLDYARKTSNGSQADTTAAHAARVNFTPRVLFNASMQCASVPAYPLLPWSSYIPALLDTPKIPTYVLARRPGIAAHLSSLVTSRWRCHKRYLHLDRTSATARIHVTTTAATSLARLVEGGHGKEKADFRWRSCVSNYQQTDVAWLSPLSIRFGCIDVRHTGYAMVTP